jgi:hypothetical protein
MLGKISQWVYGVKNEQRSSNNANRVGLCLNVSPEQAKEMGEKFVNNPAQFLQEQGLTFEQAQCPEAAHAAKKRGDDFAKEVQTSMGEFDLNEQTISQLKRTAEKHLGVDCQTEIIPFGLKFLEKMDIKDVGANWTATATGTITFADGDGDFDF